MLWTINNHDHPSSSNPPKKEQTNDRLTHNNNTTHHTHRQGPRQAQRRGARRAVPADPRGRRRERAGKVSVLFFGGGKGVRWVGVVLCVVSPWLLVGGAPAHLCFGTGLRRCEFTGTRKPDCFSPYLNQIKKKYTNKLNNHPPTHRAASRRHCRSHGSGASTSGGPSTWWSTTR